MVSSGLSHLGRVGFARSGSAANGRISIQLARSDTGARLTNWDAVDVLVLRIAQQLEGVGFGRSESFCQVSFSKQDRCGFDRQRHDFAASNKINSGSDDHAKKMRRKRTAGLLFAQRSIRVRFGCELPYAITTLLVSRALCEVLSCLGAAALIAPEGESARSRPGRSRCLVHAAWEWISICNASRREICRGAWMEICPNAKSVSERTGHGKRV